MIKLIAVFKILWKGIFIHLRTYSKFFFIIYAYYGYTILNWVDTEQTEKAPCYKSVGIATGTKSHTLNKIPFDNLAHHKEYKIGISSQYYIKAKLITPQCVALWNLVFNCVQWHIKIKDLEAEGNYLVEVITKHPSYSWNVV